MKHLIKATLLLLALLLPTLTHAHTFEVDGIYYNINGTTATVTYKGVSYSQYSNEYSGSVTIPATVTYNDTTYSVTSIGYGAFYGCYSLTAINIPNSVTTIGKYAFCYCSSLTSIDIPNSVTSIGDWAFQGCYSLTAINMPKSITYVASTAFSGLSSLAFITVASDNPKYDSRNNCNAIIETATNTLIAGCMNTTIPKSITAIGNFAFSGCTNLTKINIPNSVTNIGDEAFYGCSSLTKINIPNSVTNIGDYAFYRCTSLTKINIPNSVTAIGNDAFSGTAWFDNHPDGMVYAGLVAYCYKGNMPEGTTITLKEGTKGIADYAFSYRSSLTTINIPNSVTSIGDGAFYGSTSLTTVNIGNSVTSIGIYAFSGCSSLTSIDIPNSVTSIGDEAFSDCPSLNDIYCYATTPPRCKIYYSINCSATLHVPAASLAAYRAAHAWKDFKNIVGDADATNGHRNQSR